MDFKDKKVTVMGLGLLGGLLNDIIFLADHGVELIVTDIKSEKELRSSVEKLKHYKNITFVLGEHRREDFKERDFILQPGNVPLNSLYLEEARNNDIPIFVSESLFAKYAKGIEIVGITGTRGKSTVTQMIYETLKSDQSRSGRVFLAGNVRNTSTLALLDDVREGDMVVMELDSWALHGMGDVKISPHIAVFTTFMQDHMNYYKGDMRAYLDDKANIFKYQTPADVLVIGNQADRIIEENYASEMLAQKYVASDLDIPHDWQLKILGIHNRYNAGLAKVACEHMGVNGEVIKKMLTEFKGMQFRLEYLRDVQGVSFYNDSNGTSPDAVSAAIHSFENRNVILIAGGTDKNLDVAELAGDIQGVVKGLVLLSGSGTDRLKEFLEPASYIEAETLEECIAQARVLASEGDVVVFSPGFSSFEKFKNEYDRGEQFTTLVENI